MSVKEALAERARSKGVAVKSAPAKSVAAKSVVKNLPKPVERVRPRPVLVSVPRFESEITVTAHRFRVGESVHLTAGIYVRGGVTSVYKVTQLLPSDGIEQQYRIKSDKEPHERVAKQSQLEPAH